MSRLLFCVEEPAAAAGLKTFLDSSPEWELIGFVRDIDRLLQVLHCRQVDACLIEVTPGLNYEQLAEVRQAAPEARIVLWGRSLSPELACHAHHLGIAGFISSLADREELLTTLRSIMEGSTVPARLLERYSDSIKRIALSPREGQLVTLLAQGLKNKEIAETLGISEGTVKVYLSRLYQKVGAKDRLELALFGLRSLAPAADSDANGSSRDDRTVAPLRVLVLPRPVGRRSELPKAGRRRVVG